MYCRRIDDKKFALKPVQNLPAAAACRPAELSITYRSERHSHNENDRLRRSGKNSTTSPSAELNRNVLLRDADQRPHLALRDKTDIDSLWPHDPGLWR